MDATHGDVHDLCDFPKLNEESNTHTKCNHHVSVVIQHIPGNMDLLDNKG